MWVLFVAANEAVHFVEGFYPKDSLKWGDHKIKLEDSFVLTDNKSIPTAPSLRKRRMDSAGSTTNLSSPELPQAMCHATGIIFYLSA